MVDDALKGSSEENEAELRQIKRSVEDTSGTIMMISECLLLFLSVVYLKIIVGLFHNSRVAFDIV